jgi:arginine/lysine/ornithine decarboxylase
MATQGRAILDRIIDLSEQARQQIRQIDGLWCYGDDLIGVNGIFAYDPTKLIIRVTDAGYTGFEASRILRDEYAIDGEFADLRQVICSVTIGDTEASVQKLIDALRAMTEQKRAPIISAEEVAPPAGLPHLQLSPREAYFATSRPVAIADAVGKVVAENVIPYPPGIPLLVPGEIMEQRHLDYLHYIVRKGSAVVGPEDKTLQTLRIVE